MRLARRTSRLEFAGGTGKARLSDYPADFKATRRKAKGNKPVGFPARKARYQAMARLPIFVRDKPLPKRRRMPAQVPAWRSSLRAG
jgi:hypothetical protein